MCTDLAGEHRHHKLASYLVRLEDAQSPGWSCRPLDCFTWRFCIPSSQDQLISSWKKVKWHYRRTWSSNCAHLHRWLSNFEAISHLPDDIFMQFPSLMTCELISDSLHKRNLFNCRDGLSQVMPVESLTCFFPDELEAVLCGQGESWTPELLIDAIKFDHGYTPLQPCGVENSSKLFS